MICVCGGGGGGSSEKKMPNIWISVKIACLVSRLRTRIFIRHKLNISVLLMLS